MQFMTEFPNGSASIAIACNSETLAQDFRDIDIGKIAAVGHNVVAIALQVVNPQLVSFI